MPSEGKDEEKSEEVNIIKAVGKFFYEDEAFGQTFETWVNENCSIIDDAEIEKTGLMKVEYTELYEEYQRLFEGEIEGFIKSIGRTVEEFSSALSAGVDADPEGEDAIFAQIITATADFDIFMQMMREAKQSQDRLAASNRK
ncbi:hypothetical protein TrST_g7233 [Triparma strigata]|uniref:Cilia- and flagella-associated protein 36 n=1 Tax=Triparma strigata TaxID=1606541 RepID=A0A9W7DW85_9STRA|nr:hypothetical protein TrST_g7233 [Triparma strigata]